MRLDIELVRRGKYKSRQKAKEAIISFTIIRSGSAYPDLDFLKMA